MSKTVRLKNMCSDGVGIVGYGDVKPNQIFELPTKTWELLHKPWPESRPYRCERLAECLVEVDAKGDPLTPVAPSKKRRPKTVGQAVAEETSMAIVGNPAVANQPIDRDQSWSRKMLKGGK